MNQSIIYWKWDDHSMKSNLIEKLADLTDRFGADAISVADHWVRAPFDDEVLQGHFRECADYLHKKGKKLYAETCIRKEGAGFFKQYPKDRAWLAHMVEVQLDENGNASVELDIEPVYHFWRVSGENGPDVVLGAWAFQKHSDTEYVPESCQVIKDRVIINNSLQKTAEGRPKNTLSIQGGMESAGKTALAIVGTLQPIPDLASPHLMDYYRTMLKTAKAAHVDGVFSDEWGYDVILEVQEDRPNEHNNNLLIRHLSVSDAMAGHYRKIYGGRDMYQDMLCLYYAPAGQEEKSIAAINRYNENLRQIMADNDRKMLKAVKEILGPDAFYGVHPTWWGSVSALNFEVFKNGFYWWDAVRDIAQTDETVLMPIRTALAHKWGSSIWYNMWYSMGTLDIKTYYKETWNNVRFGGRTHYLGYECPNEPNVLQLYQPGLLEELEKMDSRVRLLDDHQTSQPDSRVLMLFGMEALTNWRLYDNPHPGWTSQNKNMEKVFRTAAKLYEKLLFDLVPTTEIANGSLKIENGKAVYGNQTYDMVVLMMPESMDPRCFVFLQQLSPDQLLVYGTGTRYNNGTLLSESDCQIIERATRDCRIPKPEVLAEEILAAEVRPNRWKNGCLFQDGSAIFTGSGELNSKNPLQVDCCLHGRHVKFTGEDFLFIRLEDGAVEVCTPKPGILKIDGKRTTFPVVCETGERS
ncbi:hypothetical protein INP51_11590 [Blautia liquoris]|mgnify:CR=1 FL=1|uniref:Uncharacterized protein n=1 Tax=Blautia liquoris TaxID=2779518 RepID=A0A7M2RE87_9FIRM|nr:hypothetical protein [Blautia liquoris]QOV18643.1 hypothetical protein INP51_11590 [Blautia liquoris]